MMLIGDSGEAGIGIGVIREHIKPRSYRKLGDDYSRFPPIPAIKNLEEVTAFIQVKIHKAKIIYHKKIRSGKSVQVIQICGFDPGLFHFTHKCIGFDIPDMSGLTHSCDADCIDQVSLPACR